MLFIRQLHEIVQSPAEKEIIIHQTLKSFTISGISTIKHNPQQLRKVLEFLNIPNLQAYPLLLRELTIEYKEFFLSVLQSEQDYVSFFNEADIRTIKAYNNIKELFLETYQPDLNFSYEFYSKEKEREKMTIESIKNTCKLEDEEIATQFFNEEKEKWLENFSKNPRNIREIELKSAAALAQKIYNQILQLDQKVGVFGGEEITLKDGRTIKIPKHAAEMLKLYLTRSESNLNSEFFIKQSIEIANNIPMQSGPTLFTKRAEETNLFYERIRNIKIPNKTKNELIHVNSPAV